MLKRLIRKFTDLEQRLEEDKTHIAALKAALAQSASGAALLDCAAAYKTRIIFDDDIASGDAAFRPDRNVVALSPFGRERALVLSLGHELRHAWQEKQGLLLRRHIHLFDHIVNVRISEADAYATEVQIAWELNQAAPKAGYWTQMKKTQGNLCRAFTLVAEQGEVGIEAGTARRAAFDTWLKSSHCRQYDYNAIAAIKGYWYRKAHGIRNAMVFNKTRSEDQPPYMSAGFLNEFGEMANGRNYLEGRNLLAQDFVIQTTAAQDRKIARIVEKYPGSDDSLIYNHL